MADDFQARVDCAVAQALLQSVIDPRQPPPLTQAQQAYQHFQPQFQHVRALGLHRGRATATATGF